MKKHQPPGRVASIILLLICGCEAPRPAPTCALGGSAAPSWVAGPAVRPPTRASLLRKFPARKPPGPATWIVPDAAHGASAKGNLLTPEAGVVTLHGIALTTRPGDEFRFVGTAMVDYQPVEATWRFWDAERTTVQQTRRGRGLAFATSARVVVFDVQISGLEPGANHEIATYVELAPRRVADTSDADVRRWLAVSRPEAPLPTLGCIAAEPAPWGDDEKRLRQRGLTAGLARVAGSDALVMSEPATIALTVEKAEPHRHAVATLVDGVPAGPAQLVRVGDGDGDVAWRSRVSVRQIPEIGIVAAVWHDPLQTGADSVWSTNFASTNFVGGAMRSREDRYEQVE